MNQQGQLKDPDDDADRENAAGARIHRGLESIHAETVRRTERDDGSVTYHNLAILAAGEWTDAATEQTVYYSPEALERIANDPAEHVVDDSVNVNHEHSDQLKQVGTFDPESLSYRDETLFADLTLHRRTQASEDTAELVDLALETDGKEGAGGPSVEIPFEGEQSEFDRDRGMERLTAFNLSGVGIVTDAASEDVAFDQQFANRAVAMADGEPAAVRVMQAGDTTKAAARPDVDMADDNEAPERTLKTDDGAEITVKADSVSDIRDALDSAGVDATLVDPEADDEPDPDREAQGENEMDMAQDLIERARQEGFDLGDNTAADLMDFIAQNLEPEEGEVNALESVADAYLQAVEAESLDATPAEGLMDFIAEQGGAETNEEPEENEDMADELGAVKEENRELRAEIDDLASRLEDLEDQPATTGSEPDDEDDDERPVDVLSGVAEDGDYYGR